MTREIQLTRGKVALVDDADYALVAGVDWYARAAYGGRFYAERKPWKGRVESMHRRIMGATGDGMRVDHIDGDGLNNTRANLRVVTHSFNLANRGPSRLNTCGYKGVGWDSRRSRWRAQIRVHGRGLALGNHPTPELAAAAYDAAVLRLRGPLAWTNAKHKAEALGVELAL